MLLVGGLNIFRDDWGTRRAKEATFECDVPSPIHMKALVRHIHQLIRWNGDQTPIAVDLVVTKFDSDITDLGVTASVSLSIRTVPRFSYGRESSR